MKLFGQLENIEIKHDNNEIKNLKTDYVLGFFGLIMQLGPIANWGLNLNKKTIEVDTEKFETNQKGIYAVGDICTYPGKLKLILSGLSLAKKSKTDPLKESNLNDNKLIFRTESAIETGWVIEATLSPQQSPDVSFTALIEVESSTRINRKYFEINAMISTIKA